MKFSVVINTFNRARSLEQTLRGLQRQTFDDFEVIVVNGPSTDGTDGLLERWRPSIRIGRCSDVNLSKSRNIGIDISSGDVVAFIDDDAIPEPDWLEQLAAGYDDERVAGVGGVVFDNTGVQLQYRYAVCDRTGRPDFDIEPPFDDFVVPGADPFLYLQGTNNSYLRRRLEEIDGFDEEIEYYLDETEVCMQLVDRGYLIRSLPGAAVHHRFQPSHLRAERGVWTNVYPQIKNRFYFALSHGRRGRSLFELMSLLMTWVDEVVGGARQAAAGGQLTRAQLAAVLAQADQATTDGTERGLVGRRRGRPIEKVDPSGFRRMPTQHPRVRLRLCFVSEEYPPGPVGGIGRFTSDLAAGLAGLGHEVHVVTRSQDVNRVDLEDDVWVHRVVIQDRRIPGLEASPLRGNLLHHFAMYHAVRRLHERRPLSLVSATIWNAEAFPFTLDPGIPSVTNLVTTLQTVADVLPSWADNPHVASLVRLEDVTLRQSRHFHSGSQAMADEIAKRSPDAGAVTHVIPHGLAATSGDSTAHPNETRTRILFVGRLERRKGVDVLLDAFVELAAEHDVELVLVGRDTPNTELGEGYREWFHRRHGGDPDVARRVRFVGEAEDQERDRWYRSADIFCAPSRYESFGLVILEAMAHGLPIVSCHTGGIPEIIDGQGLLAAPGDVASLRAQLERLVTDDAQRAAMGARAREIFDERYALERWATRTADAYATIAADEMVGEGGIDPTALADVLIEVAAVTDTVAHSVARDLVEPDAYPVDLASTCANLLVLPDDDAFIGGMYRMVFERDVDAPGLEACRKMLADGAGRLDLIEYAAGSAEGRLVRFDLGWLPRLPRLWGEALADALRPVIDLPAHEFADRLYHLVLHRPPDDQGRRRLFISLARGVPRAAIVSEMARSAEAAAKRVPTEWLESLPVTEASTRFSAATAREALRLTKSAVVGRTRRARHTLRLLPVALQQTLENGERLRELDADAEEGRIELARLASDIDAVSARLAQNQFEATSHLSSWLENLSHKYEAISLDLRERVAPRVGVSDLPEPVIVRPHTLAEHLASDRPLRLNLGCGERALAGYVNVDTRALPGVDVVADVRRLPFEASSVDEIFSSHVIEHFRRHHAEAVLLPYWRSLLRPGGALRIVTPNFGAMVARTADGEYTVEELARVTYGLQEYEGDDHFAGYDPETMERLLVRVGFDDVAIVEPERRVGLGIEMEIVARKPEDR